MNKPVARPASSKWVPLFFILFFLLLTALMASLVFTARHNYPGEVTHDAYQKGLKYNNAIAKYEEQQKLGWEGDIGFTARGQEVTLSFQLKDAQGKPLERAEVRAWLIRPTHAGNDTDIVLAHTGNGNYNATVHLAWAGEWEVHISATRDGHNYQQVKYINVP